MKSLGALLGALILFAAAPPAHAAVRTQIVGPRSVQRLVDRSPVPTVPGVQLVYHAECPDGLGGAACTGLGPDGSQPDGAMYLLDLSPFAVYYELGHRFDAVLMTDGDRHRFQTLSGYHGDWWDQGDSTGQGFSLFYTSSVGEIFSDAYATCALRLMPHPAGRASGTAWQDANGYQPSNRRQRLVCAFIRKIGARTRT